MCWEDPDLVIKALEVKKGDTVVSVASAGENCFSLLLAGAKVIAVDVNEEQLALVRLKCAAIEALTHEEFKTFLGFQDGDRLALYQKLACLDADRRGIVHSGKLERYLQKLRTWVFPLVISKRRIKEMLHLSLEEQPAFYNKYWDTWRWKLLCGLLLSKRSAVFARQKSFFKYEGTTDHLKDRIKHVLTKVPLKDNYFAEYILTGNITKTKGHPYLDKTNFHKLKGRLKDLTLLQEDITQMKGNKYNLSDIFELYSEAEFRRIIKLLKGKKCYWNNMLPRYTKITPEAEMLFSQDRCPFYSRFIVE